MFDKIKDKLQNMDLNAISTSVIASFGAASTEDLLQAIFTTLAIVSSIWTLVLSKRKDSISNEKDLIEIEIRKTDNENLKLNNEFRKAELQRYQLETARLDSNIVGFDSNSANLSGNTVIFTNNEPLIKGGLNENRGL